MADKPFYTTKEFALHLGANVEDVIGAREEGWGPKYVDPIIGEDVIYRVEDIVDWLRSLPALDPDIDRDATGEILRKSAAEARRSRRFREEACSVVAQRELQ